MHDSLASRLGCWFYELPCMRITTTHRRMMHALGIYVNALLFHSAILGRGRKFISDTSQVVWSLYSDNFVRIFFSALKNDANRSPIIIQVTTDTHQYVNRMCATRSRNLGKQVEQEEKPIGWATTSNSTLRPGSIMSLAFPTYFCRVECNRDVIQYT